MRFKHVPFVPGVPVLCPSHGKSQFKGHIESGCFVAHRSSRPHNHPSGSTDASSEDIEATKSIVQAGEILQVGVLDHLIISQGSWLSMREQRLGW